MSSRVPPDQFGPGFGVNGGQPFGELASAQPEDQPDSEHQKRWPVPG